MNCFGGPPADGVLTSHNDCGGSKPKSKLGKRRPSGYKTLGLRPLTDLDRFFVEEQVFRLVWDQRLKALKERTSVGAVGIETTSTELRTFTALEPACRFLKDTAIVKRTQKRVILRCPLGAPNTAFWRVLAAVKKS